MTTFSQVIDRTRRRLMTTQREGINTLSAGIDNAVTTLSLTNAVRFAENGKLSIDLEDMYVTSVSGGGTGAGVFRGMYGSTAAAHSSGVVVQINPTWSNWDIAQAVNDELVDLSSPSNGLFRIQSTEFDFVPTQAGYNLTATDMLDIWRVTYDQPGPSNDWPVIPRSMWRFDQSASTTDFAAGRSLTLHAGGHPGHKVRVAYKATFDSLTAIDNDVESVSGLHPEAHDILSLGAAIRLMSGLEGQRALMTTQPDPRRAEDVPPRTAVSALVPLVNQREERVNAEKARLMRRFPEAV